MAVTVGARGVRQGEYVHLHQTCERCLTMFGMEIEDSLPKEGTYYHPPKIGGCLVYCSCLSKNPWFGLAEKCLVSEDV